MRHNVNIRPVKVLSIPTLNSPRPATETWRPCKLLKSGIVVTYTLRAVLEFYISNASLHQTFKRWFCENLKKLQTWITIECSGYFRPLKTWNRDVWKLFVRKKTLIWLRSETSRLSCVKVITAGSRVIYTQSFETPGLRYRDEWTSRKLLPSIPRNSGFHLRKREVWRCFVFLTHYTLYVKLQLTENP